MQVSVELQDMHSYSPIMLVVIIVLIAVFVGTVAYMIIKKFIGREVKVKVKEFTPEDKEKIKRKYVGLLFGLEKRCREGKVSNRRAFQELSTIARRYVYETTGVKVHNYTLDEIRTINAGGLYSVVNDCYAPEFSIDKNGNIYTSIAKARKVIEEWN